MNLGFLKVICIPIVISEKMKLIFLGLKRRSSMFYYKVFSFPLLFYSIFSTSYQNRICIEYEMYCYIEISKCIY